MTLAWGNRALSDEMARIKDLTDALLKKLPLLDSRADFSKRVSFEEALTRPVHGWYVYKEGFSPSLLGLIVRRLSPPEGGVLLDPFAGVGTTILAATQLNPQRFRRAIGIEYNPFSAFVGRTKLRWAKIDPDRLRAAAQSVVAYHSRKLKPLPESATLANRDIFSFSRLTALRHISAGIDANTEGVYRAVLRLAFATILEPSSYAKKDGRALRIIDAKLRPTPPRELFTQSVERFANDIHRLKTLYRLRARHASRQRGRRVKATKIKARIYQGDARRLPRKVVPANSVDLVLYSPPYLNGIDYSEVYKVEEYMLGFIKTKADLKKVRKGTLRSHASIQFPDRVSAIERDISAQSTVRRLLKALATFFEENETRHFQSQYAWLIPAYFDDMYEALLEQARALKPGGHAVCVVANSMFSGRPLQEVEPEGEGIRHRAWQLPLATDAIIAALARHAGFKVLPSHAARSLVPRNVTAAWSRETILVFRKPASR